MRVEMIRKCWMLLLVLAVAAGCRGGIQCYNERSPSLSCPMPSYAPPDKHYRVAVVLGAGGARGMAHIGVLEEFEQANIPVDLIIGCSAGSIVGALYAKNPNACEIKGELAKIKKHDFMKMNLFMRCQALCFGHGLKRFLLKHLDNTCFEDLQIPLVVVGTDLCSGELLTFGSGMVAPVVHASCAYPLVLSPVRVYDRVVVDGGVIAPIPVATANEHYVDIVIAVDISNSLSNSMPSNLFGVAKRCTEIQYLHQSSIGTKCADIVIKPNLGNIGTFCDDYNEEMYWAGRIAAREAIPAILEALKQRPCHEVQGL